MGIDRTDIRFVCYCEMLGSVEAFYQKTGRVDRDGKPACCELLFILVILRLRSKPHFCGYKKSLRLASV